MNMLGIIIPYYKIKFFRETLQSLALQTDMRFMVYIGNDASPENPEELLKEFEGKFNFNYQRFDENLGSKSLAKQWDRCIDMMQDEEWFMILGDDDYLSTNAIKEFYSNLKIAQEEGINVFKLNSAIVDENSIVQLEKKPEPIIKSSIEHFFDKFVNEGRSSLSEHIFRRTAYQKHGFYDMALAWHSDDLAQLQFSEFGNILFLENVKCYIRVSSSSISGNRTNIREKQLSSKVFFEELGHEIHRFKGENLKRFLNLVSWAEKQKNIKINIKNRLWYYIKAYGFKGVYLYFKK